MDVEENVASSAKAEESCHDKTAIKNTAFKVSQEQVTRSSQTEAVACTNNQVRSHFTTSDSLHYVYCTLSKKNAAVMQMKCTFSAAIRKECSRIVPKP